MGLRLKILLLLMLLLVGLTGCARTLVLYPITDQDFSAIAQGDPAPIDGYIISEFYLKEVIDVKLKAK